MAENDGDKPVMRPAVAHAGEDGLNAYRVADNGSQHSCQDYFNLIKQMDQRGASLVLRMDAESRQAFRANGISKQELDGMLQSPKFSADDKKAMQVLKDGFDAAAGPDQRLSIKEMGFYLLPTMSKLGCRPEDQPGQRTNPSSGGAVPHRHSKA
jgi:hypothetical protein